MRIVPIIDALRGVLPLPEGWQWDESATQPTAEQLAGHRGYAWPDRRGEQRLEEGDGRWDEAALRVNVAVIEASKGETRAVAPTRRTSVALDDAQDAIDLAVAANRKHPRWWDMYVEQRQLDLVATHEVRGFVYRIVLRLNEPQPGEAGSGS